MLKKEYKKQHALQMLEQMGFFDIENPEPGFIRSITLVNYIDEDGDEGMGVKEEKSVSTAASTYQRQITNVLNAGSVFLTNRRIDTTKRRTTRQR